MDAAAARSSTATEADRSSQDQRRPGNCASAAKADEDSGRAVIPAVGAGSFASEAGRATPSFNTRCRPTLRKKRRSGDRRCLRHRSRRYPRSRIPIRTCRIEVCWRCWHTIVTRHRDSGADSPADGRHAIRRARTAAGFDDVRSAEPVSRRHGNRAALLAGSAHAGADLRFDGARIPTGVQTGLAAGNYVSSTGTASSAASIAADSARNLATNSIAASGHSAASTGSAVATSVETMVPLSAVAKFTPGHTPLSVNHQGPFAATTISFNLAPGRSLSDARTEIDKAIERIGMPSTVRGAFAGTAATFQQSQSSMPLLFGAALVTIYIVLGILYESLIHPLTILSTLFGKRRCGFGVMAVRHPVHHHRRDRRFAADRHRQEERDHDGRFCAGSGAAGARYARSDRRGLPLRFRPIMMTTFAALFGALPLAFGTGEGSELRHPLGITIVGGLYRQSGADAVHDAGGFHLPGQFRQVAARPVAPLLPARGRRRWPARAD